MASSSDFYRPIHLESTMGMRLARIAIPLFIFGSLVLSSCGGSSPTTSPVQEEPIEMVDLGRSTLETIIDLEGVEGNFSIVTSLGESSQVSGGVFQLEVFGEGGQLAVVLSENSVPMLMGWPTPENPTISPRTTAKALVFFSVAGFSLPSEAQAEVLETMEDLPELDALEAAILSALQENQDAFAAEDAEITQLLADTVESLEVHLESVRLGRLLVDPTGSKSGLVLNSDKGVNSIYFANSYRRTSYAFIDRLSVIDDEGTETPSPATLTDFEIPSVQALGSTTSTAIDILFGRMAFEEITTDWTQLPMVEGAAKTRYRVCVVGPGMMQGALAQLTAAEVSKQQYVTQQFVVRDLFLPMVLNILVPNSSLDEMLGFVGGGDVVGDFIAIMGQNVPGIWDRAYSGDVKGAVSDALSTFISSSTFRNIVCDMLLQRIQDRAGFEVAQTAAKNATSLLNVMKVSDLLLQSFDSSTVGYSIAQSSMADIWTVDVTEPEVKLLPATSSIDNGETVELSVSAPELSGAGLNLVYEWSNSASYGNIADGIEGHVDNFDSTQSSVTYTAKNTGEGTDTITVSVYYLDGPAQSERVLIGTATATVEVEELQEYTVSGSTGSFGMQFVVDDNLDVYLNGNMIYSTGNGYSGGHYSFSFMASQGDTLRFVVRDTWGSCASLSRLYISRYPQSAVITDGFNLGCGRPGGDQGVVFDQSATIPF